MSKTESEVAFQSSQLDQTATQTDLFIGSVEQTINDVNIIESIHTELGEHCDEGITPQAAEITDIAIESICSRLGISKQTNVIAVEAFNTKTRREATKISLENVSDVITRVWEALKLAFKKIWEKITAFFKAIYNWMTADLRLKDETIEKVKNAPDFKIQIKESKDVNAIDSNKRTFEIKNTEPPVQSINSQSAGVEVKVTDMLEELVTVYKGGDPSLVLTEFENIIKMNNAFSEFSKEAAGVIKDAERSIYHLVKSHSLNNQDSSYEKAYNEIKEKVEKLFVSNFGKDVKEAKKRLCLVSELYRNRQLEISIQNLNGLQLINVSETSLKHRTQMHEVTFDREVMDMLEHNCEGIAINTSQVLDRATTAFKDMHYRMSDACSAVIRMRDKDGLNTAEIHQLTAIRNWLNYVYTFTAKLGSIVARQAGNYQEDVYNLYKACAKVIPSSSDDKEFAEFCRRVDLADWHYSYSDDNEVYKKGKKDIEELSTIASKKGGKYKEYYDQHKK